jgi:hypothetical protein
MYLSIDIGKIKRQTYVYFTIIKDKNQKIKKNFKNTIDNIFFHVKLISV